MLDPLSALSLAAAVVQFVDFGNQLIAGGYAAYHSSSGTTAEDADAQSLARDLELLCTRLATAPPADATKYSKDEKELISLAERCQQIAKELRELLETLKVSGTSAMRGVEAARKAVLRTTKKSRIDKLQKQLDTVKMQVNTRLLNIIRNQQSSTMVSIVQLSSKNEALSVATNVRLDELRMDLLDAIQAQEREIKALKGMLSRQQAPQDPDQASQQTQYAQAVNSLHIRLDALLEASGAMATTHRILDSLTFPEMPLRKNDIREAYTETFEWIFQDRTTGFKSWLGAREGIFWVSGKAGSGKSTLMKYLDGHEKTQDILADWAAGKTLITASFYFWNAGYPMQKKQEGLLQSLLYQILRRCPHLLPKLFPKRWTADEMFHRHPDPWTRAELSVALRSIVHEDDISAKFAFFIDGLDEYESDGDYGDHRQLVLDLQTLAESPLVKLCLSSRPWTEFRDAFELDPSRYLVLQDLTRPDMDRFVRGLLGKDDLFMHLARNEPRAQTFINEILDKANGVFLWVFLVVRSLLGGLAKHDDIDVLVQRLHDLPSDLEDYFQHILDAIETTYHDRTARIFQLAVVGAPLPLTTFWYVPQEMQDPDYVLKSFLVESVGRLQALKHKRRAEYDVNAWCRDLLEVHELPDADFAITDVFLYHKADFIHRTVKDFLMLPTVQASLQGRVKGKFNPWMTLLRTYLFQAKCLSVEDGNDFGMRHFMNVAGEALYSAQQLEIQSRASRATSYEFESTSLPTLAALLAELNKVGCYYRVLRQGDYVRSHWTNVAAAANCNFIAYAISFDLSSYVRYSFQHDAKLRESTTSWRLWDFALLNRIEHERLSANRVPSEEMVRLLLEYAGDINHVARAQDENNTPWRRFLKRCFLTEDHSLWPAARILLENGADPDATAEVGSKKTFARTPKWRQERTITSPQHYSIAECLWKCCPRSEHDELDRLLLTAPRKTLREKTAPTRLWARVSASFW